MPTKHCVCIPTKNRYREHIRFHNIAPTCTLKAFTNCEYKLKLSRAQFMLTAEMSLGNIHPMLKCDEAFQFDNFRNIQIKFY